MVMLRISVSKSASHEWYCVLSSIERLVRQPQSETRIVLGDHEVLAIVTAGNVARYD